MSHEGKRLVEWAQADRDDYEASHGEGNCSCHLSPPCTACTHPGNPHNQEECDECWEDDPEEDVQ